MESRHAAREASAVEGLSPRLCCVWLLNLLPPPRPLARALWPFERSATLVAWRCNSASRPPAWMTPSLRFFPPPSSACSLARFFPAPWL